MRAKRAILYPRFSKRSKRTEYNYFKKGIKSSRFKRKARSRSLYGK